MFKKVLATIGATVGCHIPVGLLILGKLLLNPVGFWQNFMFFGAGAYVLGTIQLLGWVLLGGLLLIIWSK